MIGFIIALITLVALVAYATGYWRPKWVRQQEFSAPQRRSTDVVDRTYTVDVLEVQCSILNHVTPEKGRISNLTDVA